MVCSHCQTCKYYVKSNYLNCTVHPKAFNNPECKDWEARSAEQDLPSWERSRPIDRVTRADAANRILAEQDYRRSARLFLYVDGEWQSEEQLLQRQSLGDLTGRSEGIAIAEEDRLIGEAVIPQGTLNAGDNIEIPMGIAIAEEDLNPGDAVHLIGEGAPELMVPDRRSGRQLITDYDTWLSPGRYYIPGRYYSEFGDCITPYEVDELLSHQPRQVNPEPEPIVFNVSGGSPVAIAPEGYGSHESCLAAIDSQLSLIEEVINLKQQNQAQESAEVFDPIGSFFRKAIGFIKQLFGVN